MNIWRMNIKTDAEEGIDPSKFCIRRNILGVGWQVNEDVLIDWDAYYAEGKKKYYEKGDRGWWPAVNAIRNRMAFDDLCWTRDGDGNYYIGKIVGEWKYCSDVDFRRADVVNVRPCKWFPTGGVDSVPGKVLNSFRAPRTVQAVYDETVSFYSKLIYNKLSEKDAYDLSSQDDLDLFALIGPEDCEDIVAIFLQEKFGYRLIPSSCKLDTKMTEFVLRKPDGKAHVQVKQGAVDIHLDEFAHDPCDPCEWFLFTTNGRYVGRGHDHLHCLDPSNTRDFALANRELMPSRVQTFIDFIS